MGKAVHSRCAYAGIDSILKAVADLLDGKTLIGTTNALGWNEAGDRLRLNLEAACFTLLFTPERT